MFFAETFKKRIYVAHRTVNADGVATFGTPVSYDVNCYNILPVTASANVTPIGTSVYERKRMVGSPDYLSDIKVFDRVWVNVIPPDTEEYLAESADFVVYSIDITPMSCSILIERLPDK